MDFRLPQPVKYSLKKKKRRWKLLGGETKKLSLKHHKRNASCQTDSSESSESSATKNPQYLKFAVRSASNENCSLKSITNKQNFHSVAVEHSDTKTFHSIYHYCTPGRQNRHKDSPIPLNRFYSSNLTASISTPESMADHLAVKEANHRFLPSLKRSKNLSVPKENRRKPIKRLDNDPLSVKNNAKFSGNDGLDISPSSSKTLTSERISKTEVDSLVSCKDRKYPKTVGNSVTEISNKSSPSNSRKLESTILLSDSESPRSSIEETSHQRNPEVSVDKVPAFDLDKTTSSDMSQLLLESSLSSGDRIDLKQNEKDLNPGLKPFIRSSVLNKRFNKVVESEFAFSSNVSDFYLRVKRKVLGLQNSNSTTQDISDPSDDIILEESEDGDNADNRISENNKENYRFAPKNTSGRSSNDSLSRNNIVTPKIPSLTVSSEKSKPIDENPEIEKYELRNSPKIVPDQIGSSPQNKTEKSEKRGNNRPKELLRFPRKKFVIPESSDSENSTVNDPKANKARVRRKHDAEGRKNSNDVSEVSDSELSSSSGGIQYRRKRAVFVVGSSESENSALSKCEDQDDMDLINDFHESDLEGMNESESEQSVCLQEKQFAELEAEIVNSGSSDLLRKVTRRALVLDSSESPSVREKIETVTSNLVIKEKSENITNPNLKYQPGFSTLSQSKHEDIKKWLNTIPCSSNERSLDCKKTEKPDPKENEDNIKLTDLQQVLNELYGNDWLNKTKLTPKVVVKKKESEIIIARLTDSDDSSTPPIPPSTPKRRLYNHVHRDLGTPIPGRRNVFTPLTSIRKKGVTSIFKTPKTVDSKTKSGQRHLGSDAFSSPVLTFLASLSVDHQSGRCHPEAKYFMKNFKSKKGELARKLFQMFNAKVFSDKLPADLPIIWNNRLRKTAGYCYNRRVKSSDGSFTRTSRVELSSKIVDNTGRLRDTLIHELCHAATWIISEVTGGHGPTWKRWTYKAMEAFPEIPSISRCHNYDIETKFKYKCSGCNYSIGRHSKSLDVERKVCGICGGRFELFVNKKNDKGKAMPTTPRTPNAFALFVKENYGSAKKSKENLKHKDVMKILSEQFAATKISNAIAEEKD